MGNYTSKISIRRQTIEVKPDALHVAIKQVGGLTVTGGIVGIPGITIDPDGGLTIQNLTRITIKGPTGQDQY